MNDTRARALHLRLGGLSYSQIGQQLGLSRQRIQQLIRPPKEIYAYVCSRAFGRCQDCGINVKHGHVHHNNPDLERGYNDIENLVYLCVSCHRKRHAADDLAGSISNSTKAGLERARQAGKKLGRPFKPIDDNEIIELRKSMSVREIATKFGVGTVTIYNRLKNFNH